MDTSKTSHGRYEHDYDGRPPVGEYEGDDPLLERLRKYHVLVDAPRPLKNPGVPDEAGGSD